MKALVLPGVLLLFGLASCNSERSKQSQSPGSDSKMISVPASADACDPGPKDKNSKAESDQSGLSNHLHSAETHFKNHDVRSARMELDEALKIDGTSSEALNLRGSCHVETRDFDHALQDFVSAAEQAPGNPSIQFNIGETYFVTKKWSESLERFERLRKELQPADHELAALIDFKVMLCHRALGHIDEFNRLAGEHQSATDSPISDFSRMAIDYSRDEPSEAERHLEAAARKFSEPKALAPWKDTLIEYGWYQPRKR